IRVLREYERGVMFTLGRFTGAKGPGLVLVIPVVQQMVKVDMRTIVMDVPSQDVISKDNISVKVNAVIYFRVVDPERAVIQVEDYYAATSQLAQTTLRSVLGQHELDEMLAEREKLNSDIQAILDEQTDSWGIKVSNVEIKHVDIDESMIRAIARQAEAERDRRACIILAERESIDAEHPSTVDEPTDSWRIKVSHVEIQHVDIGESMSRAIARQAEAERDRRARIILAEGELQASEKLHQAALVMSKNP